MELNEESQDKMILDLGCSLNSITSVLRKTERDTILRNTGEGHVKTEAETGVMLSQAKDAWSHPKLKEAGNFLS